MSEGDGTGSLVEGVIEEEVEWSSWIFLCATTFGLRKSGVSL